MAVHKNVMHFRSINAVVKPSDKLVLIFGSFPIEIHPFASEVALEERAIHGFVDKRDLERAYMDSNGNKDHAIDEYDAYLQLVSKLFRWKYDDRRTMDSGIAQLMR